MQPSSCELMARVADRLASDPARPADARAFVAEFALQVAGIRTGRGAAWGLLTGGRSRLKGGGFRPEFRDRTAGQSRHFAGIARAATVLGPGATVWLSEHVRRDARDSPDGRLTILAVEFSASLADGSLPVSGAGQWIRSNVCG